MTSKLESLNQWVDEVAQHTRPDHIHWCDGSDAEYETLVNEMLETGELIELNQKTHPGCYLHRSSLSDVARNEKLTLVCHPEREDAGPNNHWEAPADAHEKIDGLFEGCMEGRTMYVIPYCMGPIGSPISRCGVEITDSRYVVANMRIMTRMGQAALERIEREGKFVRGQHSTGEMDPDRRWIMHFPEELSIKSYGSGYGGNALLGKKCHALRIGSHQARSEGWLAEHMLIVGVENPEGEIHYIAGAFPSACGKTNLAMLIPPEGYQKDGWKVWTVGDDICWMQRGSDGRLWAINPEAGYFGVAPGTSEKTNPNALEMLQHDTIFTNVAVTEDMQPWWEGLDDRVPATDWKGNPYNPASGDKAAHPNSRFTVSATQCPSWSPEAEAADGVPISAIVFGGRRSELVPLVFESHDWAHGVLVGASMASEKTAAAADVGSNIRRDPMAMKPFCGYNYGDYFKHWLSFSEAGAENLPHIFHVNWFQKDADGNIMWPGFTENMRVLEWMLERVKGTVEGRETAIGTLPADGEINTDGLDLPDGTMDQLLHVDNAGWKGEMAAVGEYLDGYGQHCPDRLKSELKRVTDALDTAESTTAKAASSS